MILENVRTHIEEERQIGADVTVTAATPRTVNVVVTVKVANGYNVTDIQLNVQSALQAYINNVNREDFNTPPTRNDQNQGSAISYYRIGDLIFGVDGVADILSYTLDGGVTSLMSGYEEFFTLGEVDVSGAQ